MSRSLIKLALWKALGSFVSVTAGWAGGLIVLAAFWLVLSLRSENVWAEVSSGVVVYSAVIGGFAISVWLVILLPLYVLLPDTSPLWRTRVCTALGIIAGGGIVLAYLLIGGGIFALFLWPLVVVGAVVGGVTCLFGASTAPYFRGGERSNQSLEPTADRRGE